MDSEEAPWIEYTKKKAKNKIKTMRVLKKL